MQNGKKLLLIIGVFIMLAQNINAEMAYTPTSSIDCNNAVCKQTLYSGEQFAQDSNGNWVNSSDVLRITRDEDDLIFHYDGIKGKFNITFETGVIYNGNYISMSQVKTNNPQINFNFPTTETETTGKYAINITDIPLSVIPNIQNITLTYKSHQGFDLVKLKSLAKNFNVNDGIGLFFDDLIENNFQVEISIPDRRIYIGNLSDKFVSNSLYLDPTLTLQDANTENLGDAPANTDNIGINEGTDVRMGVSSKKRNRIYTMFDLTQLPVGAKIENATLFLNVESGNEWGISPRNFNIHHVFNHTWNETNVSGANQPCNAVYGEAFNTNSPAGKCNSTIADIVSVNATANKWYNWSVVAGVKKDYNDVYNNASFIILDSAEDTGSPNLFLYFRTKEYTSDTTLRPKMEVVYTQDLAFPSINITINNTLPKINDVINISANVTDDVSIATINITINFTTGTIFKNYTINLTGINLTVFNDTQITDNSGDVLNITVYATDKGRNVTQNSTVITVANTLPILGNVSIALLPLAQGDTATGYFNFSDADSDFIIHNKSYWYINKTLCLICNDTRTLGGNNVTNGGNITYSIMIGDKYDNTTFVNSSTATVGDTAVPTLTSLNLTELNLTFKCSDTLSTIKKANYTLKKPDGTFETKDSNLDFSIDINSLSNIINVTLNDKHTLVNGSYNVTQIGCEDGNSNYFENVTTRDLNFSIVPIKILTSLQSSSITTVQTNKMNITCTSDPKLKINKINFTLKIPDGSLLLRYTPTFFSIIENSSINTTYELFSISETANIGAYNITQVGCRDNENTYVENITTFGLNFDIIAVPSGGTTTTGGGGSGSSRETIIITENATEGEILSVTCGNRVCDNNENPRNCNADCPLNIDTLLSGETFGQAWFTKLLISFLVIVVLLSVYKGQKKQEKKRHRYVTPK